MIWPRLETPGKMLLKGSPENDLLGLRNIPQTPQTPTIAPNLQEIFQAPMPVNELTTDNIIAGGGGLTKDQGDKMIALMIEQNEKDVIGKFKAGTVQLSMERILATI